MGGAASVSAFARAIARAQALTSGGIIGVDVLPLPRLGAELEDEVEMEHFRKLGTAELDFDQGTYLTPRELGLIPKEDLAAEELAKPWTHFDEQRFLKRQIGFGRYDGATDLFGGFYESEMRKSDGVFGGVGATEGRCLGGRVAGAADAEECTVCKPVDVRNLSEVVAQRVDAWRTECYEKRLEHWKEACEIRDRLSGRGEAAADGSARARGRSVSPRGRGGAEDVEMEDAEAPVSDKKKKKKKKSKRSGRNLNGEPRSLQEALQLLRKTSPCPDFRTPSTAVS